MANSLPKPPVAPVMSAVPLPVCIIIPLSIQNDGHKPCLRRYSGGSTMTAESPARRYSGGSTRLKTMPLMRMIAMHTGAM